ncbi:MAG: SCE4755 family polysaccharide monooxygenase-like protein [Vicinamibacterales bacterium]
MMDRVTVLEEIAMHLIKSASPAVIAAAALLAVPQTIGAHFKLLEPASWIVESERGDPQKAAPCGTDPKAEMSGAVTKVTGGSKVHLKVLETIYHPGHYRVALAVNSRDELPPDPMTFERTTEKGPRSVWAVIQSPPQLPVLADGLFQHYTRPASPQTYEADVALPNINCPKCTLQVIQFMAEHGYNQPGGYSYHHCADLTITADPAKPLDKGWPAPATTAAP